VQPAPPRYAPERVANAIVALARRPRRRERIVGAAGHQLRAAHALLPPLFERVNAWYVDASISSTAPRHGRMGTSTPRSTARRVSTAAGASRAVVVARPWRPGTVYGLGRGRAPAALRLAPPAADGAAWGLVVWLVNYAGWLPKLGLMPAPEHDKPGRPAAMIAAHLVYGATLGALLGRRA
jgi:hypothetical protein